MVCKNGDFRPLVDVSPKQVLVMTKIAIGH